MDTSEEYIKMCEKATEIQTPMIDQEDGVFIGDEKDFWTLVKDKYVYLPRQDQLQGMIGKLYAVEPGLGYVADFFHWWNTGENFFNKITKDKSQVWFPPKSMEQLWLAYTMLLKFNKVWDGEEWNKCQNSN